MIISKNSNLNIQDIPDSFRENIELWIKIWKNHCELIGNYDENTYSRNIILLIPDLIEEIEFNYDNFSKNIYAKNYFFSQLIEYQKNCNYNNKTNIKQKITDHISDEIDFIIDALRPKNTSNTFDLKSLLGILKTIDNSIINTSQFEITLQMLVDYLDDDKPIKIDDNDLSFLTVSLILMFWRNGKEAQAIKDLSFNIMSIYNNINNVYYSDYPEYPNQEDLTELKYKEKLEVFFNTLTVKDRFEQIKNLFIKEPKEFRVIFGVTGLDLQFEEFSIGNVTIYDQRKKKFIINPKFGKYGEEYKDLLNIENPKNEGHCISIVVKGTDSPSMKTQARKSAELALAFLSKREKRRDPYKLSNEFSICDLNGIERSWSSGGTKTKDIYFETWKDITDNERNRYGLWMKQEKPSPTIQRWFTALEWHRKSIESNQSSQELLNSWFAIEHLFTENMNISLRVPNYLYSRPAVKENNGLWLNNKKNALIQMIVTFLEIKSIYRETASNVVMKLIFPIERAFNKKPEYYPPDNLLKKFADVNDQSFHVGDFIDTLPEIISNINTHTGNIKLQNNLDELYKLFYDSKYSKMIITDEFWRIKDDIYNIYRIRNMLVHMASSQSKLIEYYAARAREYSFTLLDYMKWMLLRTQDDNQIQSLEFYFQELVIDSNKCLEAIPNDKMKIFREWIFHD